MFLMKLNKAETKFATRKILTGRPMSSICAKEFSDSNFFFKKLPQITHIHKNCHFKSIIAFFDQLFLPYKCHGSSMRGILFRFCQFEPLRYVKQYLWLKQEYTGEKQEYIMNKAKKRK